MQNKKLDEFFGTEFLISLFLDYPLRTLKQELICRQRMWLTESEIFYFLDSLISPLAFLQAKAIPHQNLSFENIYLTRLINGSIAIKIMDPMMKGGTIPQSTQTEADLVNPYKNDVLILGLV